MEKELTCDQRVDSHLKSTLETLRELWEGYCSGDDDKTQDFYNYGLSFDYVAPNTFQDQEQGYYRYQLSWGGPSDEFRFYVNPDFSCYKIVYWFLDWFDGASRCLKGKDKELLSEVFNNFKECGSVEHCYNQSLEY